MRFNFSYIATEDVERGLEFWKKERIGAQTRRWDFDLREHEHGHVVTIEMRASDIGRLSGAKSDLVEEIPKRSEYDSRFLKWPLSSW